MPVFHLTTAFDHVEALGRLDLVPCPLATHWQTHGVPPTTVCTHITQPLDVVLHQLPRVAFDGHCRQFGRQGCEDLGRQRAHFRARVDVVLGEDTR